jgi:hypothetical protein
MALKADLPPPVAAQPANIDRRRPAELDRRRLTEEEDQTLALHHHDSHYTPAEPDPSSRRDSDTTLHAEADVEKLVHKYPNDLVTFDGDDDPKNPRNWSTRYKASITMLLGATTCGATFTSSVFTAASPSIQRDYGISPEVATLGLSLYVAGFIAGPVLWAPLSETFGRKPSIVLPYFAFVCLNAATAVSKDIQSIMICRFFAGVFGSAPVANVGGALGDLWDIKSRGIAVVFCRFFSLRDFSTDASLDSFAVVGGPSMIQMPQLPC